MTLLSVIGLMVLFHLKHYVADYPLQGKYMRGKFLDKGWILPLSAHCAVHAAFSFCICIGFLLHTRNGLALAAALSLFDFSIHFAMDRVKASPNMMGRWKNFTGKDWEFMKAGYFPPNIAQMEFPTQGNYFKPYITPKKLEPGDEDKIEHDNKLFWLALGFDQLVHGLTDVAIIYLLLSNA